MPIEPDSKFLFFEKILIPLLDHRKDRGCLHFFTIRAVDSEILVLDRCDVPEYPENAKKSVLHRGLNCTFSAHYNFSK